ncbi:class I SAM-dependent methyltransferase [Neisseria leonii]|uniref:Class I SAM-dependent methyltransferase n=1 Tax=Neisseria leonii TaxID=2995413 RepID=A0A9X4E191_9NEIS|nr:class I SAM-dependent methyltransferase [Neisseria sp. 51.81]MDD9326899.1 methyltransferase domain-containing protein [Neisseria sp. 51.81]
MMLQNTAAEFSNERSVKYRQAVSNVQHIWQDDLEVMYSYLAPSTGEKILEIGAGSGFFSFPIAEAIGDKGMLYALDPSADQLTPIKEANLPNVFPIIASAEDFLLPGQVDKIWSRGHFIMWSIKPDL